jgi:tRNA A-37 threonylcarbamoyl transferase component Bud32
VLKLRRRALAAYLSSLFGDKVEILFVSELGKEREELKELKAFGYGIPLLVEFKVRGEERKVVLETIRPGGFGHDYMSDRAATLLWEYNNFNRLPRHVKAVDIGAFADADLLQSIGRAREFFLLVDYAAGREYRYDLEELRNGRELLPLDEERCRTLARYLASIHRRKKDAPELYVRRIRELVGHSECVMGLVDSYASDLRFLRPGELKEIEQECNEWRWRIKKRGERLCQIHGDFHPWNILFRGEVDFSLLDRSRGEYGEAADDVSALAINYLFFSLQKSGRLAGAYEKLWNLFFEVYLEETGDRAVFEVIQPFFAWRGLVIASPIWYPQLSDEVRRAIFNFIHGVLEAEVFDPYRANGPLLQD